MFSDIAIAFQALSANKLRAALTMLGTIIGVTCVVALWNIGESGRAYMDNALEAIGQNLIFVTPRYNVDEEDQRRSQYHPLSLREVEAIRTECPSVEAVSPMLQFQTSVSAGPRSHTARIEGCFPSYLDIRKWKIRSGTAFTESERRSRAHVVLLGSQLAEEIFPGVDPLGERIRVNNIPFTVLGVMQQRGSLFGHNQDDMLIMPYDTLAECMGQGRDVYMIFVSAATRAGIPQAKKEIIAAIRTAQKIPPGRKDPVQLQDLGEMARVTDSVLIGATMLLGAIGAISLLVGGIGIMNIMLVSVTERTREIGLRIALGATDSNILIQFLVEAITLSAVGGLIGAGCGLGVSAAAVKILSMATQREWPLLFSTASVLVAVVFSMGVGVFFGFYPAWRASRLDPIVALRRE